MRKTFPAMPTHTMVNVAVKRTASRICQTGGPGGNAMRSIIIMGVVGGKKEKAVARKLFGDSMMICIKSMGSIMMIMAGVIRL